MARILLLGFPAFGHVHPTLPVVTELAKRGHDVTYLNGEPFRETIEAAGARFLRYPGRFLQDASELASRMPEAPALLLEATQTVFEDVLPKIQGDPCDLVMFDSLAPWGPGVAARLGIPSAASISTFALHRDMMRLARGFDRPGPRSVVRKLRSVARAVAIRRSLRRRHGLPIPGLLGLYCVRGDRNLVYTSRELQPGGDDFGDAHRFVGPCIGPRADARGDFPFERIRTDRPRVLVSLGTLFRDDADLFEQAITAIERAGGQAIAAVGSEELASSLGARWPDAIVRAWIPQPEVLARVDLFVTRGGMNSVSEALVAGVPVLVIPHLAEQAVVGRRVEELGAGAVLSRRNANATSIDAAARDLLREPHPRERAKAIGEKLLEGGGASAAVDTVEAQIAARSRP